MLFVFVLFFFSFIPFFFFFFFFNDTATTEIYTLSLHDALPISYGLERMPTPTGASIVPHPGWGFRLLTMITLTAGTSLIMWIGEQISEKGIGNGISMIIFAGIVVRLPSAIVASYTLITTGEMKLFVFGALCALMLAVTAAVVLMQEGQRKIPVQYAPRGVGRRAYGRARYPPSPPDHNP